MLGGALGLGVADRNQAQAFAPAAPAASAATSTASAAVATSRLTFSGNHWHTTSLDRRKGELLGHGDRLTTYGELLDAPGGNKIGEFYASGFHMQAPLGVGAVGTGRIELHTFSLSDGTIMGMGLAAAGTGSESAFTILGGTGRYAGARGTYTARQRPQELGGNGTAEFTFELIQG